MYSNIKRIYTQHSLNSDNHITLTSSQIHYLKNVLRVKINDYIRIFNGLDGEWLAKVQTIKKKEIDLILEKKIKDQNNFSRIDIFFSPIKKDRINILVQKCTELGIKNFFPIKSERTNIKNLNIKNLQQNAIEASQQSERMDIPKIKELKSLEECINSLDKDYCLIFCDETKNEKNNIIDIMKKIHDKFSKWVLIIGPEGGFSDNDRNKILNFQNTYPVSLGKRILRSDTAAAAALFCMEKYINY
ncbi:MAG: Ribosomal RNA small subunit methyltransferase E [Alphaproteobacteria bacterium MarineAlpha5_Bin12]|nr:16S rRNA (uracil(1498)-N(3))-methyltransferase [Pelagibacteraceae bacterium]PPR41240.1 MAG: Ribosomal RNA small subunit methyltransferase E [Alphaproteobacteria bacterium MarineAlpha5_Bin12]|tara:strand:+ start:17859 stop:18593 length:735 start_codon:yes stop_codon:yes gene_type:complete